MRLAAIVVLFLASVQCLGATTIRVASWNVRNYNSSDRVVDGKWTPSAPKDEAEKAALRRAILSLRPDVILFQEMGPPEYLEELRLDLDGEGLTYAYSAHLSAADPERCLAALSRIPFDSIGKESHLSYRSGGEDREVRRGLLALSFVTDGQRWTLFNIHLKSREPGSLGQSATQRDRIAEAEALRNAMLARAGNDGDSARWLLAGDTNDEPGGAVWKRLTSKGGASIGIDLRPADGRGEYWTYYFSSRDSYERIDILMASEAMSRSIPKDSPRICDDPAMKASDHRMLYTDLVFPDAGKDSVANSTDGESDGSVNSATPGE